LGEDALLSSSIRTARLYFYSRLYLLLLTNGRGNDRHTGDPQSDARIAIGFVVVGRPAYIKPVSIEGIDANHPFRAQEREYQVIKAERCIVRNVLKYTSVECVYTHTNSQFLQGLLSKAAHDILFFVSIYDTEIDLGDSLGRGYGEKGAVPQMVLVEIMEVEIGQQITIHHKEVIRQITHQLDRRHGTQETGFL